IDMLDRAAQRYGELIVRRITDRSGCSQRFQPVYRAGETEVVRKPVPMCVVDEQTTRQFRSGKGPAQPQAAFPPSVVAYRSGRLGAGHIGGRPAGEVDDAGRRIMPIERALRSAQDLDLLNVAEAPVELGIGEGHTIEID